MLLRIIRMTVIVFAACSTIPLKVAITVLVKPTCIASLRSVTTSSTNVSLKVCHLLVNTAACLPIVHSVAHRYLAHFTLVAKLANSCSSVRILL